MTKPYLSIVTVSYNAAETLHDTLQSVAHQTYQNFEHLLIDGGSTDNTAAVIREFGKHLAHRVSEPDAGLYDAMNKGACRAQGYALAFLNADDWYADSHVLFHVAAAFQQGADVVYGDLAFVRSDPPFEVTRVWKDYPRSPSDFFACGWQPAHPTTFVRRELFDEVGGFDLRFRISADYAFLARLMTRSELKIVHLPMRMVNMRVGGASTAGWRAIARGNAECFSALRELGAVHPLRTLMCKTGRKVGQFRRIDAARESAIVWRPWMDAAAPPLAGR